MVCIVQRVHEIPVEGVDICKFGKAIEDRLQLFRKGFSSIFDLACVELLQSLFSRCAFAMVIWCQSTARILLILKPLRIWVGRRRCVRLRTMSRNSCEFGTGAISFHVVFILNEYMAIAWRSVKVEKRRGKKSAHEIDKADNNSVRVLHKYFCVLAWLVASG
jgi:hypothetical protein